MAWPPPPPLRGPSQRSPEVAPEDLQGRQGPGQPSGPRPRSSTQGHGAASFPGKSSSWEGGRKGSATPGKAKDRQPGQQPLSQATLEGGPRPPPTVKHSAANWLWQSKKDYLHFLKMQSRHFMKGS